jgi:hypothetical protein
MAVRFGLPKELRIPALTRVPAQALGIWDRVGSLEPGKDADVALWTGDPCDPKSACLVTFVNGRLAYDAKTMGRRYLAARRASRDLHATRATPTFAAFVALAARRRFRRARRPAAAATTATTTTSRSSAAG